VARLLAHCRPRLHLFSGSELAQMAWGCAVLGHQMPERTVNALLSAIMQQRSESAGWSAGWSVGVGAGGIALRRLAVCAAFFTPGTPLASSQFLTDHF